MAEIKYWLPPFDPDANYIVAAWPEGFTIGGYQPRRGEPFDKSSINSRSVLEELYVKRWIAVCDDSEDSAPSQPPAAPAERQQLSRKQRKLLRRNVAA